MHNFGSESNQLDSEELILLKNKLLGVMADLERTAAEHFDYRGFLRKSLDVIGEVNLKVRRRFCVAIKLFETHICNETQTRQFVCIEQIGDV